MQDEEAREELGHGIHSMLSQSIKFDHGAINCIQRVGIELLKFDGFTIDANLIAQTGK
jgi:hypothetical protein